VGWGMLIPAILLSSLTVLIGVLFPFTYQLFIR
jgi:hypothetical protein